MATPASHHLRNGNTRYPNHHSHSALVQGGHASSWAQHWDITGFWQEIQKLTEKGVLVVVSLPDGKRGKRVLWGVRRGVGEDLRRVGQVQAALGPALADGLDALDAGLLLVRRVRVDTVILVLAQHVAVDLDALAVEFGMVVLHGIVVGVWLSGVFHLRLRRRRDFWLRQRWGRGECVM
jgi:hypothetical protein